MREFKGFDRKDIYKEVPRLPTGGYVLEILGVKEQVNDWGSVLVISFDIADGEYKGFYANNYKAQQTEDKKWKGNYRLHVPKDDGSESDTWKKKRFNTFIVDIEESNSGYYWNWDEKTLVGKKIGGIFNNKEWRVDDKTGFFTNCHSLVPVEKIRSGNFKIPADTLLPSQYTGPTAPVSDEFVSIPDGLANELPF